MSKVDRSEHRRIKVWRRECPPHDVETLSLLIPVAYLPTPPPPYAHRHRCWWATSTAPRLSFKVRAVSIFFTRFGDHPGRWWVPSRGSDTGALRRQDSGAIPRGRLSRTIRQTLRARSRLAARNRGWIA